MKSKISLLTLFLVIVVLTSTGCSSLSDIENRINASLSSTKKENTANATSMQPQNIVVNKVALYKDSKDSAEGVLLLNLTVTNILNKGKVTTGQELFSLVAGDQTISSSFGANYLKNSLNTVCFYLLLI